MKLAHVWCKRAVVLSLVLAFGCPLWASNEPIPADLAISSTTEDVTRDLLTESGIKKLTEQIPALIAMGMEQAGRASLKPVDLEQLRGLAATAFSPKKLFEGIVTDCSRQLSVERVKKLLEWHQQPLARKMVAFETERSSPEKIPDMQKFMSELAAKPLSQKRVDLFGRLDKALKSTENNLQLVTKVQFGMMKALSRMDPNAPKSEEEFAVAEAQARENMGRMIGDQVLGSWGFIYQDVPDQELEAYVTFYESEDGILWSGVVSQALIKAIENASQALGTLIGETFRSPPPVKPEAPAAN